MRKCATEVSRLKAVMGRAGGRQAVLAEEESVCVRGVCVWCVEERESERASEREREAGRVWGREVMGGFKFIF